MVLSVRLLHLEMSPIRLFPVDMLMLVLIRDQHNMLLLIKVRLTIHRLHSGVMLVTPPVPLMMLI